MEKIGPNTRLFKTNCPLKEAAKEAPKMAACIENGITYTFADLDSLVDKTKPTPVIKEPAGLKVVLKFFSALREGKSVFLANPKGPACIENPIGPNHSVLLQTSGSTGRPKLAVLSFKSLIQNAIDVAHHLELKPGDLWKLNLPLNHVSGIGIMLRSILSRSTFTFDDHPETTHLSLVPTHLYRFSPVYKKLKCILLGGAPIHHISQFLPIYPTYGLTEMGSSVVIGNQILENRQLKIDSQGEILVKGPTLFEGYLNEERQVGWFATKDLGKMENGKLQLIGRKDWMFISGGENIQPEEIEFHLLQFPEVINAAVVPIDDPEFGKRPIALVEANKTFSFTEMKERLLPYLPNFKIPIRLFFLDRLSQNHSFKLNRFFLIQYAKNQLDKIHAGKKK